MVHNRIDEAVEAAILEDYRRGVSHRRLAKNHGVSPSTVYNVLKRASALGKFGPQETMPGFEIRRRASALKDGVVEKEWIEQKPERGPVYEAPKGYFARSYSINTDGDGRLVQQWAKLDADATAKEEYLRAIFDALKADIGRAAPIPRPEFCASKLLNNYILTDYHWGMLAWGHETRGEDWDITIASKTFDQWLNVSTALSPPARVGVLAITGDYLHYDGMESVTSRSGHQLDTDTRFPKIISVAIRAARRAVQALLEKHQEVIVIFAPGNHDEVSSAWLREMFMQFYEDEPRLKTATCSSNYHCVEHGGTAPQHRLRRQAETRRAPPLQLPRR